MHGQFLVGATMVSKNDFGGIEQLTVNTEPFRERACTQIMIDAIPKCY